MKESVPDIYFATYEGRIKAYSLANSRVRTVVDRKESTRGIAYDSVGNRIYWSTFWSYKIQRATMDGLDVETVLSTRQCTHIFRLLVINIFITFPHLPSFSLLAQMGTFSV